MAEIVFKDLTADNLFDLCSVLDAVGINSVISAFDNREIVAMQKSNKSMKDIGIVITMKIVGVIIKNIPKAKDEICTFFANCSEWDDGTAVTASDFSGMKIVPFVKLIKEFSKKEDLTDFFGVVSEFVNTEQENSTSCLTEDMADPTSI